MHFEQQHKEFDELGMNLVAKSSKQYLDNLENLVIEAHRGGRLPDNSLLSF
jgi:hypothetical protein